MTARRHHYVPRFLLSGFTESGSAGGKLHVLKLDDGRGWESTPEKSAHQRDYYRIEAPGLPPDAFEADLAKIEARAAEVIRDTVTSLEPPSGDALRALVEFLAIMASRTPPNIDHHAKQEAQLLRMMLQTQIGHPKGFEKLMEKARAEGRPMDDTTPEQLLQALDNSDISFPSTWTVQRLMMHAEALLPFLLPRKWCLLVPQPGAGEFVCSDMPAVTHDPTPRDAFYGPSFAAPESEFAMPLSRHVVLMGRFEKESAAFAVNRKTIAVMNGRAMMYANHVYSARPDFDWWMQGDRIGGVADLRAAIAARPREGGELQ